MKLGDGPIVGSDVASTYPSDEHLFYIDKVWAQQSGSTNLATGTYPFEVHDRGALSRNIIVAQETARIPITTNAPPDSNYIILARNSGYAQAIAEYFTSTGPIEQIDLRNDMIRSEQAHITTRINFATEISSIDVTSFWVGLFGDSLPAGGTNFAFGGSDAATYQISYDTTSVGIFSSPLTQLVINKDRRRFYSVWHGTILDAPLISTYSFQTAAQLKSEVYNNYSIFAQQVNCSDIAISENPFGILSHVFSEAELNFVTSQMSDAMVDTSSYNFQCYFGEREPVGTIVNDFGEISATYLWIGDSGYLNARTYQQSEDVIVNRTITTCDYITGSFKFHDNPLGTTVFDVQRAKRVKVNYDYSFATSKYNKVITADPSNNAACNSVDASGVKNEILKQTKYIKETLTSSLYSNNLIRKHTTDQTIIEMVLPARFFDLELADVVKVQNPLLINSESLFQITTVSPNYLNGQVYIKATELLPNIIT
jgi:hypothetical protein